MKVTPYLFFAGQCAEAIQHYQSVVGADVLFQMQYKDAPEALPEGMDDPAMADCILHASLKIGESEIMLCDIPAANHTGNNGYSLAITVHEESQAREIFAALSKQGSIQMPLAPTFYSPCFGTLTDKFGIEWMINLDTESK